MICSRLHFIVINHIIFFLFPPPTIFCIFVCNAMSKAQCATGTMETISPTAFKKNIVCLAMYRVVLYSCTSAQYWHCLSFGSIWHHFGTVCTCQSSYAGLFVCFFPLTLSQRLRTSPSLMFTGPLISSFLFCSCWCLPGTGTSLFYSYFYTPSVTLASHSLIFLAYCKVYFLNYGMTKGGRSWGEDD